MMNMNVIMPMAGAGSRVQPNDAPPVFKPFIEVEGKPLYLHAKESLPKTSQFNFFAVFTIEQENEFNVSEVLVQENIHCIILPEKTSGPLDTVAQALQKNNISGPIICLDSDLAFSSIGFEFFLNQKNVLIDGALLYFKSSSANYSYLKLENGTQRVTEVKEKVVISENAICGCYFFKSSELLLSRINSIKQNCPGEVYVSHLFQDMVELDKQIIAIPVDSYHSFGTLKDLKKYDEVILTSSTSSE